MTNHVSRSTSLGTTWVDDVDGMGTTFLQLFPYQFIILSMSVEVVVHVYMIGCSIMACSLVPCIPSEW